MDADFHQYELSKQYFLFDLHLVIRLLAKWVRRQDILTDRLTVSRNVTSPHLTSPHLTSPHLTSSEMGA
jgi:hypothetical protein